MAIEELTSLIGQWHREGEGPTPMIAARGILQLAEIIATIQKQNPSLTYSHLKVTNILVEGKAGERQFRLNDSFTALEKENVDFREDVYALAVIWKQILLGEFNEGPPEILQWRKLVDSGMSDELFDLFASCFQSDAPANALDLAEKLETQLPAPSPTRDDAFTPTPMSSPQLRVYEPATPSEVKINYNDLVEYPLEVAFSRDGQRLFAGGRDWKVRAYSTDNWREVGWREPGNGPVTTLCHSRDASCLVVGCTDRTLTIFDPSTLQPRKKLEGHDAGIICAAVSRDGRYVVSGSYDGTMKLWNVESGEAILTLDEEVIAVDISGNGQWVLSASDRSGEVKVFELSTGTELLCINDHSRIGAAKFSLDDKEILLGGQAGLFEVRLVDTGRKRYAINLPTSDVTCLGRCSNAKFVAVGTSEGRVCIVDTFTGRRHETFNAHARPVYGVAFSPDNKKLASCSGDKTIKIRDVDLY